MPLPPPQADRGHDYIPEQVGRSIYDSLKILGLGLGASEGKVKLAYRRLACLYHLDKWEQARTNTRMMLQETTAHLRLLNNAQIFICTTLLTAGIPTSPENPSQKNLFADLSLMDLSLRQLSSFPHPHHLT
jgi:hypothetical protein